MGSRGSSLSGTARCPAVRLGDQQRAHKRSARRCLALIPSLLLLFGCTTLWTADPPPLTRPFLWEVQAGEHRSYLFGTMHIGLLTKSNLPPSVKQALDASRHFVMEVDPDTNPRELLPFVVRGDGTTLDKALSPQSWEQLKTLLADGHPEDVLRKYRAWFAYSALMTKELSTSEFDTKAARSRPLPAMDVFLAGMAAGRGMTVGYLETAREQMRMLDQAISDADLEVVLEQIRTKKGDFSKQHITTYRSGDDEALDHEIRETHDDEGMSPDDIRILIDERNERWLRQLLPLLKSHDTFVAVGAAHLVGKVGLVALLRENGLKVRRIDGVNPR